MEKRVGIYLRVSTSGQNTEIQLKEVTEYLQARGINNWEVYEDIQSGTTDARPALRRILKDAKSRKINVLVCWKLDRLFRSLKDLLTTIQELNDHRVDFISVRDQIDLTTASGRLMIQLVGAFAEFEAALIRERVRAGLRNARSKGVQLGRPQKVNSNEILLLRRKGLSLSSIGNQIGASKSTVSKTLKKLHLQGIEITQAQSPVLEVEKSKDYETQPLVRKRVNHD